MEATTLDNDSKTMDRITSKCTRLNEDINLMSNLASHGLKSPLTVMSTYCTSLEEKLTSPAQSEELGWVTEIHQQADRMRDMIAVLFDYLSIEAGSDKAKQRVETNEVVNGVIANARLGSNGDSITINCDPLPAVMGRTKQIALLFANLIDNAIKFKSEKPPVIQISARHQGPMVEFSITDNGIGIDDSYHEIIFILFQKIDPNGEYPGLGAGLAICKKIVECSGGSIRVESTVGSGSTFYFTLPEA